MSKRPIRKWAVVSIKDEFGNELQLAKFIADGDAYRFAQDKATVYFSPDRLWNKPWIEVKLIDTDGLKHFWLRDDLAAKAA